MREPATARPRRMIVTAPAIAAVLGWASVAGAACANPGIPGAAHQGFGADTTGGAGRPVYQVTTLADSGPGSLRDALSRGDRCVVFAVAGDIVLRKPLSVRGAFVTVDGLSAPAPGITLRDYGIAVWGSGGARDVILRGLRIRDAGHRTCAGMRDHRAGACWDGIQIKNGAARVLIDHVSVDNASDGAIDIARSSDVTVQWSILSGTRKTVLLAASTRISMHHNLFVGGLTRNPQADWDPKGGSTPPDTVLDLRNNVVWDFAAYGTVVRGAATVNVVRNYYHSAARPSAAQALVVRGPARVHAAGNASGTGADVNAHGTEPDALPAARLLTADPCTAVAEVRDGAGARGRAVELDAVDRAAVARITTPRPSDCTATGGRAPVASERPAETGGSPR
jgi:pectate lyase